MILATGKCVECKTDKIVPIIGKREHARCQYHYRLYLQLNSRNKAKKILKQDKKVSVSGHLIPHEAVLYTPNLVLWYQEKMQNSTPVCENCGDFIHAAAHSSFVWHGCQAHILPKRKQYGFPSVATHPLNHMVLCMFGNACHGKYDSSWLNASRMPVFEIAKARFKQFESEIWFEERKRIPEIFLL